MYIRIMNKADIINEISRETGMEKSAVVLIVEKFMANVKEALADGENIYLRGFGTFLVKTRKERIARNISRKTAVIIPERRVAAFRPSRLLTEDINANFKPIDNQ